MRVWRNNFPPLLIKVKYFRDLDDLRSNWAVDHTWKPVRDDSKRKEMCCLWKHAVSKSFDWVMQEGC
jgi:glycerol kinase